MAKSKVGNIEYKAGSKKTAVKNTASTTKVATNTKGKGSDARQRTSKKVAAGKTKSSS